MSEDLLRIATGKQDGELFATDAVRFSTAAHSGESGCHQPKHLVPAIVAVRVVDAFKVVDINRCDCIRWLQGRKRVVECAARTEAGEFVAIGKRVGVLHDATGEYQP